MKKIMFNDLFRLTQAVLDRRKTQTRRPDFLPISIIEAIEYGASPSIAIPLSRYKVGEEVAIAQSYSKMLIRDMLAVQKETGEQFLLEKFKPSKGWSNKMFVAAKYMPHRIRITNVRVERLQDISEEDCLKEGIISDNGRYIVKTYKGVTFYTTDARLAFKYLIDKICGKGTWESNPYVFVYDFELVR